MEASWPIGGLSAYLVVMDVSPEVPEEITEAQREELRDDLHALRDALSAFLAQSKGSAGPVELDPSKMGRLSRIDAIQVQKMTESHLRDAEMRLRLVKAALNRMDRDEYGTCASCEEPIAFLRLKAHPEVRLCIACQRELEEERHGHHEVPPRKRRAPGSAG